MKNLIPILILALLSGCVTRKSCERRFPPSSDTVRIVSNTVTTYKDTVIVVRVKGDTVFRTLSLTKEPLRSQMNTPFATSTALVKDGKLTHRLEQKDTLLDLTIRNAQKTTITNNSKERIVTRIQKVDEITRWQWVQIWMGRVMIVALLIYGCWLITKVYIPLKFLHYTEKSNL